MIKRILVPLDGSSLAETVLPQVEELAKVLGAEVHFLQVVGQAAGAAALGAGPGMVISPDVITAQLEAEASEAESYLTALTADWRTKGVSTQWESITDPVRGAAAAIVDYAKAHNVDLIAMSTHGRSGLSRLVSGSVAEAVVREGVAPVLLVRPPKKK